MYLVFFNEIQGNHRVVSCSACRHQWIAKEKHLLYGEQAVSSSKLPDDNDRDVDDDLKADDVRQSNAGRRRGRRVGLRRRTYEENRAELKGNASYEKVDDKMEVAPRRNDNTSEVERKQLSTILASTTNYARRSISRRRNNSERSYTKPHQSYSIFIGNLSYQVTNKELIKLFEKYGKVKNCSIPCYNSGLSKGYGFIEMDDFEQVKIAIRDLQGSVYFGREISVQEAARSVGNQRFEYRNGGGDSGNELVGEVASEAHREESLSGNDSNGAENEVNPQSNRYPRRNGPGGRGRYRQRYSFGRRRRNSSNGESSS